MLEERVVALEKALREIKDLPGIKKELADAAEAVTKAKEVKRAPKKED